MIPPASWTRLVTSLLGLPGVGPRMAERMALHLLKRPSSSEELLTALHHARETLRRCARCGDLMEMTEGGHCRRCLDTNRDPSLLCVVEDVADLQALERSRAFQGGYHVLGGVLSALDGIGPEDLRIEALMERLAQEPVREVILATNPTAEGETTASYLADILQARSLTVTRLAYGLPSGAAIQYADELTLSRALEGRQSFSLR